MDREKLRCHSDNRPQPHQMEPASPSFIHHAAPLRHWRVTGPVTVTVTYIIIIRFTNEANKMQTIIIQNENVDIFYTEIESALELANLPGTILAKGDFNEKMCTASVSILGKYGLGEPKNVNSRNGSHTRGRSLMISQVPKKTPPYCIPIKKLTSKSIKLPRFR
ncbi:hypothetical protein RRG08_038357 [Elysia crispata]|uniref:Uncharacterized protein n=1 Tax=Elysia crispata TaxID=231223 RepID=A0AAE1DXP9_9GAST|nr:hypothetical protein RRG08_038357 [Elysia crispata]